MNCNHLSLIITSDPSLLRQQLVDWHKYFLHTYILINILKNDTFAEPFLYY